MPNELWIIGIAQALVVADDVQPAKRSTINVRATDVWDATWLYGPTAHIFPLALSDVNETEKRKFAMSALDLPLSGSRIQPNFPKVVDD